LFYTIYKITNKINDKFYIGKHQTYDLNDNYMGSGKLIKRAIEKHGIKNFTKEILHVFNSEEEMNAKEKELVILTEDSYNLCPGGRGGFGYINASNLNNSVNNAQRGGQKFSVMLKTDKKYKKNFKKKVSEGISPAAREIISSNTKKLHKDGILSYSTMNTKEAIEKKKKTFNEIKHQKGTNNSQYGTCWINDGKHNKKVSKLEINYWIDKGFIKGRIVQ